MSFINNCRLCHGKLSSVILDLGMQPPSNDFHTYSPGSWRVQYPLQLVQCTECLLPQISYDVPPTEIFNQGYALHSSKGSASWLEHAKELAEHCTDLYDLGTDSLVIEIGSNDGYLLKNFSNVPVLGIDPTGIASCVPTMVAPFTAALAATFEKKADVIIALNTVAQIPDLRDFFEGLSLALHSEGVAILEFPNPVRTFEGGQFDQIYHEHYSYLTCTALRIALYKVGMHISNLEFLHTHGGSLRVFIRHGVQPMSSRVAKQCMSEAMLDLRSFARRAQHCRTEFRSFLTGADITGQRVAGYGAAAKGSTFLSYVFEAPWHPSYKLTCIGEVSPEKIGKRSPSGVPVVSEEDMLATDPDYILLLAWNWRDEAVKRLRAKGFDGSFVVAVPHLEVF